MNETVVGQAVQSGGFKIYWIISLAVCVAAAAISASRLKRGRDGHLWSLILLQVTITVVMFFNFAAQLNWYHPLISDATRIGAMVTTSLMIVCLSAFINSQPVTRLNRHIGRFFFAAGAALAVHYVVSAIVFFVSRYDGSRKYFGGYRYIPAFSVFIILALAAVYMVTAILVAKPVSAADKTRVAILRVLAYTMIVLLPVNFLLDQLRYLFPPLWRLLEEERLFATPLSVALVNLILIWYAVRGMNGEKTPASSFADLSVREREVAGLLCQGRSYKEIAGELNISLPTVQSHVTNIYRKTGVSKKTDLMLIGRETP